MCFNLFYIRNDTTSNFFLGTFVPLLEALIITGIILNFQLHIRFISFYNLVYLISFPLHFRLRILLNLLVCIFSTFCF